MALPILRELSQKDWLKIILHIASSDVTKDSSSLEKRTEALLITDLDPHDSKVEIQDFSKSARFLAWAEQKYGPCTITITDDDGFHPALIVRTKLAIIISDDNRAGNGCLL